MTRKEIAIENLRQAVEEFNNISNSNVDIDVVMQAIRYSNIESINMKTQYYKDMTADIILRNKVNDYFESPEGAIKKAQMEARQEEIRKEHEQLAVDTADKINKALSEAGINIYPYKVENIMDNRLTFVNQNSSKKYYLRIEIYFAKNYRKDDEIRPEINVAALGSINLIEPSEGKDYYMTIGNLFANGTKIYEIYNELCGAGSEYELKITELGEEYDKINRWLSKPFKEMV